MILVADSSKDRYLQLLPNNVTYHYFSNISIIEKLYKITKLVKTKYMFFCADDDFWVKESILSCIDFLESNSDYSSVQGKYIDFICKNHAFYTPSYLHAVSIEDNGIAERLNSCMKNYMPLFYAMHRSEVLQRVFSDNYNTGLEHAILNEISVSIYSLIYGKHKSYDLMTYVRDDESLPTPVKRDNLRDISINREFKTEYNQFIHNISNLIEEKNANLNGEKIVKNAVSLYIEEISKEMQESKIKNIFKKYFYFTKIFINSCRRKINTLKKFRKTMTTRGYPHSDSKAKKSWEEISKIIEKHHIKV